MASSTPLRSVRRVRPPTIFISDLKYPILRPVPSLRDSNPWYSACRTDIRCPLAGVQEARPRGCTMKCLFHDAHGETHARHRQHARPPAQHKRIHAPTTITHAGTAHLPQRRASLPRPLPPYSITGGSPHTPWICGVAGPRQSSATQTGASTGPTAPAAPSSTTACSPRRRGRPHPRGRSVTGAASSVGSRNVNGGPRGAHGAHTARGGRQAMYPRDRQRH